MPTPPKGYYNSSGKRVPSVTTILSRFKDSGALIHWANQLAYKPYRELRALVGKIVDDPILSPEIHAAMKSALSKPEDFCDYRKARDKAAGIGTVVHDRVDCYIRKVEFVPDEYISVDIPDPTTASEVGFQAFKEWAGSTKFKLVEGEKQYVSDKFNYGGTPDVVLVRGKKTIGDWKTGGIYAEQLIPQLAAYREVLREHGMELDGGGHAMSINRDTGGFTHRFFTEEEMDRGWKAFLMMRELYDLVKKMAGKSSETTEMSDKSI